MIQLSQYAERVIDRISMVGMWLAVTTCIRNFIICLRQYRRTHGVIHLMNMAQVVVLFIHRLLFGIVPVFEVTTCVFWPLLVSLWHLNYIIFYSIMFKRLLILESDRNSLWIKIVGIFLITLRFADWPYELAFHTLQQQLMSQEIVSGSNCLAQWGEGVIILNFVADSLANVFLSGMFVRRLYVHIRKSRSIMSHRNQVIEYIARKSLVCLILTFVTNLIMNLFKITRFLGDRSDAFTVYFEIIESTLLVEALRVDYTRLQDQSFCEHCGMVLHQSDNSSRKNPRKVHENINLPARVSARSFDRASAYREIPYPSSTDAPHRYSEHSIHHNHIPSTTRMTAEV
ncbi:unnamed protein product [Mucor hiemalis]